MKKRNSNHQPPIDDEDELTVKQIKDGLEKLDEWHPGSAPNLQWFQESVETEKKRIRKKLWKDLLAFIAVAVLVLSVVIAVVYRQPVLYLYLQLAGIVLLPFVLNTTRKKVRNENE